MENLWDKVKQHPYLIGGSIVAVVVVVLMLNSGSGNTGNTSTDNAAIQAGLALQAQQADIQNQQYVAGLQYQAQAGSQATQLKLAQIAADYQTQANETAANVQLANINATSQTQQLESTLQAQTQQAQITSQTQQYQMLTGVLQNQIDAQKAVSLAAQQPHGLFSFLFG